MIYLDNASTTKPSDAVKNQITETLDIFGNPSSMHRLGIDAEKIIKQAKENLSRSLKVNSNEVYFTSGGTEANNTAILGYCRRNKKRGTHIITSEIEHPSAREPFKRLEGEGFKVSYINTLPSGEIDIFDFENKLTSDTIFVSIMWVNNETGVIQPVEQLKPIMKKIAPNAILHTDGVQAYGKIPTHPKSIGVDMMSISGHKIHAIKGIGALYIANNLNIDPYIIGGGQQNDMRSGTENVVGISALSKAIEDLTVDADFQKISDLRSYFCELIAQKIENKKFNGEGNLSPYILNVSFPGIKAEILLHALEARDIFVSTGSACSTNKPMPSHVLSAMGCTKAEINGAVRFSFNNEITKDDIEKVAEILKFEVETLRKVMR